MNRSVDNNWLACKALATSKSLIITAVYFESEMNIIELQVRLKDLHVMLSLQNSLYRDVMLVQNSFVEKIQCNAPEIQSSISGLVQSHGFECKSSYVEIEKQNHDL